MEAVTGLFSTVGIVCLEIWAGENLGLSLPQIRGPIQGVSICELGRHFHYSGRRLLYHLLNEKIAYHQSLHCMVAWFENFVRSTGRLPKNL